MKVFARESDRRNVKLLQSFRPLLDPGSSVYRSVLNEFRPPSPTRPPNWSPTKELKGTRVDAVKEEKIGKRAIYGWSAATVREVTETHVACLFIGSSSSTNFAKDSEKIAPFRTHTEDYTWRDELKEGDSIDVCDTDGKWFLGTVLKLRPRQHSATKECLAAYRVYLESGSKEDRERGRYEGWSEKYDEWIHAHSLRIQKPSSLSRKGTVYCQDAVDVDMRVPEDADDILLNVRAW